MNHQHQLTYSYIKLKHELFNSLKKYKNNTFKYICNKPIK